MFRSYGALLVAVGLVGCGGLDPAAFPLGESSLPFLLGERDVVVAVVDALTGEALPTELVEDGASVAKVTGDFPLETTGAAGGGRGGDDASNTNDPMPVRAHNALYVPVDEAESQRAFGAGGGDAANTNDPMPVRVDLVRLPDGRLVFVTTEGSAPGTESSNTNDPMPVRSGGDGSRQASDKL